MDRPHILLSTLAGLMALTAGCAGHNSRATTQPATAPALATDIPPETALASYWLDEPPMVSVRSSSYSDLMQECDHVLRQRFFQIDRLDYRTGLLESKPLVSKQLWEFWRSDVGSTQQTLASSVGTYSRTVHWQVTPDAGGGFSAIPHVVVERFTAPPRHVTTLIDFRDVLTRSESQTGLSQSNLDAIPVSRWYAIGRDKALEVELAQDLLDRMLTHTSSATLQRNPATNSR
jgi:hypothetical protein